MTDRGQIKCPSYIRQVTKKQRTLPCICIHACSSDALHSIQGMATDAQLTPYIQVTCGKHCLLVKLQAMPIGMRSLHTSSCHTACNRVGNMQGRLPCRSGTYMKIQHHAVPFSQYSSTALLRSIKGIEALAGTAISSYHLFPSKNHDNGHYCIRSEHHMKQPDLPV